jgi:hypothetical protein
MVPLIDGAVPDSPIRDEPGGLWDANRVALTWAIAVALTGLAVRWWQVAGRSPSWWQDSEDYWTVSGRSLWSRDFWMAERPAAVPLLLQLTGGKVGAWFVKAQIVLAALSWGWLAGELVRAVAPSWRRGAPVAAGVLAFSLSTPVTMWDRSVLSESMTVSLLAALAAALLGLVREPSWGRGTVLVGVAWLWSTTRDTNVVTLVVLAAAAGIWAARSADHRRLASAVAAGLLVVTAGSMQSAMVGDRDALPLADAFPVRVLPYPERVEWFVATRCPWPTTSGPRRLQAIRAPIHSTRRWSGSPATTPYFQPWWDWLRAHGKATFIRWVVAHPTYAVAEPMASPERVFNNTEGDLGFYAATDMPKVPFISELFWPSTPVSIVAAAALAHALARRRRYGPVITVGGLMVYRRQPAASSAGTAAAWRPPAIFSPGRSDCAWACCWRPQLASSRRRRCHGALRGSATRPNRATAKMRSPRASRRQPAHRSPDHHDREAHREGHGYGSSAAAP